MDNEQIEKLVKEEYARIENETWGSPKIHAIRKYMDLTSKGLGESKKEVEKIINKWESQ